MQNTGTASDTSVTLQPARMRTVIGGDQLNNVVSCISPVEDKQDCPYLKVCLARLTDKTITGCGIPLYEAGIIPYEAVLIRKTIEDEESER